MAHFAKLKPSNNVVLTVVKVSDDNASTEQEGINFLKTVYNQPDAIWKQTSYNTLGNVHLLGGTPFRKNFAKINGVYDSSKDAFIDEKPHASFILNEDTCLWEAPVAMPSELPVDSDGNPTSYKWDESSLSWVVSPWDPPSI
jgi:hypothetical protein|tara:strand:+ start:213 stop:638 length:426 start_codon:yes stop_codon:yes gene_type:complete